MGDFVGGEDVKAEAGAAESLGFGLGELHDGAAESFTAMLGEDLDVE